MKQQGIVKFFNDARGFGFIKPDEGAQDIFFHISALNGMQSIDQDVRIAFEINENQRGKFAENIELI